VLAQGRARARHLGMTVFPNAISNLCHREVLRAAKPRRTHGRQPLSAAFRIGLWVLREAKPRRAHYHHAALSSMSSRTPRSLRSGRLEGCTSPMHLSSVKNTPSEESRRAGDGHRNGRSGRRCQGRQAAAKLPGQRIHDARAETGFDGSAGQACADPDPIIRNSGTPGALRWLKADDDVALGLARKTYVRSFTTRSCDQAHADGLLRCRRSLARLHPDRDRLII